MERPQEHGRAPGALTAAGRAAAAACGVLAVAVVAIVIWRSAALFALLYVAAILAVVLDRPVNALVRRGLARAWALGWVLTGVGAASAAILVAFGVLVAQVTQLGSAAPALAQRLQALPVRWRAESSGRRAGWRTPPARS
jgi:predicted PurR-regulated permease PerM